MERRRRCRLPRPFAQDDDASPFESLPPDCMATILSRVLPRDAIGSLAVASKGTRAAVTRALVSLALPAALPPPQTRPRAGDVWGGIMRLNMHGRWAPEARGNRYGPADFLREFGDLMPHLRDCALDLRTRRFESGWILGARHARLPRALRSLRLIDAPDEVIDALGRDDSLKNGLETLWLCYRETWPSAHFGRGRPFPIGRSSMWRANPPSLAGFTALRELRLAARWNTRWRVSRATVERLTSLRLSDWREGRPGERVESERHSLEDEWWLAWDAGDQDPDDDGEVLLCTHAQSARWLMTRAWPRLRHLELPDDGYSYADAERRSTDPLLPLPPPPPPLLFFEAFPNLECLCVGTSSYSAPALAASLHGLRRLRRLAVIRRELYWHSQPPPGAVERSLAASEAIYRRGGWSTNARGGGGGGGGGDGAREVSARELALRGLGALVRSPVANSALEIIIGLVLHPTNHVDGMSRPPDITSVINDRPLFLGRALAATFAPSDGSDSGGGSHDLGEDVDDEEDPFARRSPFFPRDFVEWQLQGPWWLRVQGFGPAPLVERTLVGGGAGGSGIDSGSGGSGGGGDGGTHVAAGTSGERQLIVLTPFYGPRERVVVASARRGVPIGAASVTQGSDGEGQLRAAERALAGFSGLTWRQASDEPPTTEWHPEDPIVPPPGLDALQRMTLLRWWSPSNRSEPAHAAWASLRARLAHLDVDAGWLRSGSLCGCDCCRRSYVSSLARRRQKQSPSDTTYPVSSGARPLLLSLPRLRRLCVREQSAAERSAVAESPEEAGRERERAPLVWAALASGVVPACVYGGGPRCGACCGCRACAVVGFDVGSSSGGARGSFAAALASATEVAAATRRRRAWWRPFSSSLPPDASSAPAGLPPIEWLRLENFLDAGSSPASVRAIASYCPTLRALEISGAERAPLVAPLVALLSSPHCPRLSCLCIERTALPSGWLAQAAALLGEPLAHFTSTAWIAHVLAAVPGLPRAAALAAALAEGAIRQAPRLLEMFATAHLAAFAALVVGWIAALRVWAAAAAAAVFRGRLEPPGAALAGRLRLLGLQGCTQEIEHEEPGILLDPLPSPLVNFVRACPNLRYLDLRYMNHSVFELRPLCVEGGDGAPITAAAAATADPSRCRRRHPTLAYVNVDHDREPDRWFAPSRPISSPLLVADSNFAQRVIARELGTGDW